MAFMGSATRMARRVGHRSTLSMRASRSPWVRRVSASASSACDAGSGGGGVDPLCPLGPPPSSHAPSRRRRKSSRRAEFQRQLANGPDLASFVPGDVADGMPCSVASFVPVRSVHSDTRVEAARPTPQAPDSSSLPSPHIDTVLIYDWTAGSGYVPDSTRASHKKYTDEEFFKWTRLPPTEAYTIPPSAYYNPKFFDIEKNHLFARSWVAVGVEDKVREWGDTFLATVANQPLFITKSKDGKVRGFFNVCRHRGAKLLKRDGKYGVISCPYHRWAYSGDGRLLATPHFKGDGVEKGQMPPGATDPNAEHDAVPDAAVREAYATDKVKNFNKKDYGLFSVRTEVRHGIVFVNIDNGAVDIDTYLGDVNAQLADHPLDELKLVKTGEYNVNANWKLLAENFVEYMHLPAVHPDLCTVSGVAEHIRTQGRGQNVSFVTHPITRGGTPLDAGVLPAMPGLGPRNSNTAWFQLLFPNVFYFGFPHSWFVVILNPTSPTTTTETAYMLVHPDTLAAEDSEEKVEAMWDFYVDVNNEDIEVCESVQEGIVSGPYQGGRVTFEFEEAVWRFQNMVIDYMTSKSRVWGGDKVQDYPWREKDKPVPESEE